jgi:hypothetical protein
VSDSQEVIHVEADRVEIGDRAIVEEKVIDAQGYEEAARSKARGYRARSFVAKLLSKTGKQSENA